ncbi:outer membrane receptor protein involved in Fe transport [Mucilaginibacter frigoritolerans]|uniref:Outer membrane receptor protein involved in Fe transport n=1 Tax=Mucilaginibacter frigoritolerans TaxID=652788 RepID=A0A562U6Z6_9SPHI|nr:outer membrane beta-barrel protein [Mucilaginibacter frigoritolerans]TWJ01600.1 outer membrane receptor protein involved in Fe transport [Mucilaginibacter frigoritolerans]
MKQAYFFLTFILLLSIRTYAQTGRDVHGTVTDSTKLTLPGSTVKLLTATDSITTVTDAKGAFVFPGVKATQFSLVIQSIGFDPVRRRITLDNTNQPVFLRPIILKTSTTMLNTVVIADALPIKVKEDTIEFNAAAYPVRDGAPIEDVIRKVPGADVDASGNITFQGKSVTKVRVNGKDFFGGDLKTATQNLPADAVQNVQFVNDYGDQANLTGIKSGDPETILNINIKPSRNHGYFGQVSAGDGADAIPQVAGTKDADRYIAQGNLFNFNGDQQIAVLANLNNTNTSLFNFGGPGGRQGGGGPGSSATNNGITTQRSIGLNYRDSWGKKITVYGSYSFSDNTVNTISTTIQNNISLSNPTTNTQTSNETDRKVNHRFTFNMEYKPDTVNYLKISPSFSYAGVHTIQTGSNILARTDTALTLTDYSYNSLVHSSSPNYGLNVLYNHRFNGHGRNFSVNLGAGRSETDQYQNPVYNYISGNPNAPLNQYITTDSHTDTVSTYISYIEPIAKHSYLELNYNYKHSNTVADKETDTLSTDGSINMYPLLSNDYTYNFIINRVGLNYRFIQKKYNYVLGVTGQSALLEGSSLDSAPTHLTSYNFSPNAHFVYNISRTQTFSANYSGASNQPTYSELQPVTDFSSALYPVTGNPDLKPEYNNTFSVRYNNFDFTSGNVFFSNMSFVQTDNKIVANTITYPKKYTLNNKLAGTIATDYLNAPGYYSASAFYVFAKPWEKRKYNLFFVGNASYTNNISYISNVDSTNYRETTEKNIAKTLVLSQGIRFRVDITDIIDAEASSTYTVNSSQNSISQSGIQDNFRSLVLGLNGKNYIWNNWTYSYDYTKTLYYGYKGATNPNIFNTYVERRFLKGNMATLRLSAMDVFNQNTGYTNTQNGSYTTQTNANRLGRYYLLTFTYRFRKTAGTAPKMGPGPGGMGPPPGGGFGGPPPGGGPSVD